MTSPTDTNFNPHDYPCVGFPDRNIVLSNKPLSYWKKIMEQVERGYSANGSIRINYFTWKFREFCEFENIPHIRIGGKDGGQIFWYLLHLILPRTVGLDGDGI